MNDDFPSPKFIRVDSAWSKVELLNQKGWFPFADVMKKLDPDHPVNYRKILNYRKLSKEKKDINATMGLKYFGARVWADMTVFSRWYRKKENLHVHDVPKNWNFHFFLKQKSGIFSMRSVVRLFPKDLSFSQGELRKLIKKKKDPRKEIGAAKMEGASYVVFMPRFGEWFLNQVPDPNRFRAP